MSQAPELHVVRTTAHSKTPGPSTRKRTHGSITNLQSQKRRRMSMPSVDLSRALDTDISVGRSTKRVGGVADRFVSHRPKTFLPLNITPRTMRISKQFGLIDDKVLNFKDDTDIFPTMYKKDTTLALLRKSASTLFNIPPTARPCSVTENLSKRKHCVMVLDSPGVSGDADAYPITWSRSNLIAVACKNEVYYQNLNTKTVSHLGTTTFPGTLGVIQWAARAWRATLRRGTARVRLLGPPLGGRSDMTGRTMKSAVTRLFTCVDKWAFK
ncbi:hypothetical protein NLJ89_g6788 [Agrocybe chaxingu]|uniref:Uncharacterized protein n=1 Tax=Agrocybe chaxingu TaxID=84603 RepID=A0A9W8MW28_9AGAR|nr:hypothetical protein NLJ89_g6788 [Agrocybe chaxingu]